MTSVENDTDSFHVPACVFFCNKSMPETQLDPNPNKIVRVYMNGCIEPWYLKILAEPQKNLKNTLIFWV